MQIPGPLAPGVSDGAGLEWACEFACLTGGQMEPMLLVPGPCFENNASRGWIIIDLTRPLLMDSDVVSIFGRMDCAGLDDPAQGSYCVPACSGLPEQESLGTVRLSPYLF